MAENKDFIIQIKGLQIGKHEYDFPIDGSFFREFENSQILDADLDAERGFFGAKPYLHTASFPEKARSKKERSTPK